jgi:argininosuccinate synthase
VITTAPAAAPDSPAVVNLRLEQGAPCAINDVVMPLTELIDSLSLIAGRHGIGRLPGAEAPAAVVLNAALQVQRHGTVRMKLFKGACEQVPELVAHS